MIIELTGIPAVGKSTLIQSLINRNDGNIVVFSYDMFLSHYHLHFIKYKPLRKIVSELLLYILFIINLNNYHSYINYYIRMLSTMKDGFFIKLNVFRNIILKFAVFNFVSTKCKDLIVIVDEGISHIPFNFIDCCGEQEVDLMAIFDGMGSVTGQISVVRLEREPESVKACLERRGHRRLQGKALYTIDQFMHRNRLVSAAFESLPDHIFSGKFLLQLGSPHDDDSFIQLLENEILK